MMPISESVYNGQDTMKLRTHLPHSIIWVNNAHGALSDVYDQYTTGYRVFERLKETFVRRGISSTKGL